VEDSARGLYAARTGHVKVHQDYVGLKLGGQSDSSTSISSLANHLQVGRRAQQCTQPLAEVVVIVGDE
jgi:hypothetical protein